MLNNKKIVMNYANSRDRHRGGAHTSVSSDGRNPSHFGSPSNLSTTDDVRALRAALEEEGDCKWGIAQCRIADRRHIRQELRMLRRRSHIGERKVRGTGND
ncbi:hypothetical protein Hypma_011942 [Hypsizygus marmoreus]|uniref:Uncharacterized protein n=1 Tax=Hypsizygus marmoreus TaxID=39966 RepID=A0A369JQU5_HYPMA|nr:hypothetical protein Hypma_011942 [Hypsizygus marmoreus]